MDRLFTFDCTCFGCTPEDCQFHTGEEDPLKDHCIGYYPLRCKGNCEECIARYLCYTSTDEDGIILISPDEWQWLYYSGEFIIDDNFSMQSTGTIEVNTYKYMGGN